MSARLPASPADHHTSGPEGYPRVEPSTQQTEEAETLQLCCRLLGPQLLWARMQESVPAWKNGWAQRQHWEQLGNLQRVDTWTCGPQVSPGTEIKLLASRSPG